MKKERSDSLVIHATEARKRLLQMIFNAKAGHTGGSLSSVDILTALYFDIMNIRPEHPEYPDRDRFIMSKGHSVEALYAVLSRRGFFDDNVLDTYGEKGSILAGHPTRKVPGVELNSGALGHGLSVGVGLALAAIRSGFPWRTYVLMGDGEHGEGSIMEAAAAAGHYRLDNLIAIIDRNKLQISGATEEVMAIDDLAMKYTACGWKVGECDGNNVEDLITTIRNTPFEPGRPSLVIAHTVKGKGVSFMENKANWHHKVPSEQELELALIELDAKIREEVK